ncbi:modifier of mdg4-like isoform X7 [Culicoides brevitarsis]|uniref:modifier of mdg4-like isoform X7 n=1 Tax=Culicoides brevitarsis TaxID=469753 RepID=UPI00307CB5DB
MAEDEQFSLSWNNFNSNLSAGFHESLCRGDLVDVTLAADGQLVKAHRLVLSVCSPYFRKMFTQMPANQHAFVFLKDVSHAALKDLIQFMYCGEVNVKQDALPAFISTAEALQIKGLTETGESVPQTQPQTTTTVLTAAPVTVAKESTRITTVPVHQTIATTSRTFKSPRVSATTAYKLAAAAGDSEDSADDKVVQAMTMQAQATSTPATVHTTVKRTQKSITPQSAPASKRMKVQTSTADPLEAVEPTQITMHGDKDDEFINIPIEQLQNPKTEPHDTQYAEQASAAQVTEVEGHEQDTTYVEDDGTYGEIAKYDDSYFTEGDETAKAGQSSFGESYTATTDQGQEAQGTANKRYIKAQYVENIIGNPQLIVRGYVFHKKETKKGMYTYWRCAYHKEFNCKARMKTNFKDDICEIFVGQHTHPIKTKDAGKKKMARPIQDVVPRTSYAPSTVKEEDTSQDDFYSHFLVPEVQLDANLPENSIADDAEEIFGDM